MRFRLEIHTVGQNILNQKVVAGNMYVISLASKIRLMLLDLNGHSNILKLIEKSHQLKKE